MRWTRALRWMLLLMLSALAAGQAPGAVVQRDKLFQFPQVGALTMKCIFGSHPEISGPEVLSGRYPDVDAIHVSSKCKQQARAKVDAWIQADIADWKHLATRACSYKTGWVEYKPGTCQAGGPPPLCPVNHWYQDPVAAATAWQKDKQNVKRKRAEELAQEACDCALAEIQSADAAEAAAAGSHQRRNAPARTGGLAVLCQSTAECDSVGPGLVCVQGRCERPAPAETEMNRALFAAGGTLADAAREKAINVLLSSISKSLAAARESLAGSIIVGLFDATEIGTSRQVYIDKADDVANEERKLAYDQRTWDHCHRTPDDCTEPEVTYLAQDAARVRKQLTRNIAWLGEAYQGVLAERDLGKACCYSMFSYEHRKLMNDFGQLMGLTAGMTATIPAQQ